MNVQPKWDMPFVVETKKTARGNILVWSDELSEWGYGKTLEEALSDFADNVREVAALLAENQLGPKMKQIKDSLERHLRATFTA